LTVLSLVLSCLVHKKCTMKVVTMYRLLNLRPIQVDQFTKFTKIDEEFTKFTKKYTGGFQDART